MGAEITLPETASFEQAEIRGLAFLLGFYFSFRLAIVLFSVRLLGLQPSTGSALSIGLDLMLFGLICFATVGGRQRAIRLELRLPAVRWVLAYLAFACLSFVWSESANLMHSFAYWIGLVTDVANMVLLLRMGSGTDVAHAVMKGFVWGTCCIALVAWMMPRTPDRRLGDDQFMGPNPIGYLCALACFFAQYLLRERAQRLLVAQSTLLAVTVLRSLSKTTIVAFVVSEGFLLAADKSTRRGGKLLVTLSAAAVVVVMWGLLVSYYGVYTSSGSEAATLSGRLGIWAYFLAEAVRRPWIGHGFDSVRHVVPPFGPGQFEAAHAHNELLQQFYTYGLVGVGMFFGIYGSLYLQIRRLAKGSLRSLLLAFLLFVLVHGTAEADRIDLLLPVWAIVMLSVVIEQARGEEGGPGRACSH